MRVIRYREPYTERKYFFCKISRLKIYKNNKGTRMIIGDKKVREIVVTNKEKELIISITDNDIITRDGCSVEVIQDCCDYLYPRI